MAAADRLLIYAVLWFGIHLSLPHMLVSSGPGVCLLDILHVQVASRHLYLLLFASPCGTLAAASNLAEPTMVVQRDERKTTSNYIVRRMATSIVGKNLHHGNKRSRI